MQGISHRWGERKLSKILNGKTSNLTTEEQREYTALPFAASYRNRGIFSVWYDRLKHCKLYTLFIQLRGLDRMHSRRVQSRDVVQPWSGAYLKLSLRVIFGQ